ncbi:pilin [Amycolatopsis lurida]
MRVTPQPQLHEHTAGSKRPERPPSPRRVVRRMAAAAILGALVLSTVTADSAHGATEVVALAQTVKEVFDNIRNWLVGILAGLATVFLTVGGVRYLMASGNPGEVEKAKQAFKSAGWGYALAALAPLVVEILRGIVGA